MLWFCILYVLWLANGHPGGGDLLRHVRSNEALPSALGDLRGHVSHVWTNLKSCVNVFT